MVPIEAAFLGRLIIQRGERAGSQIISANDGFYYHIHMARENSNYAHLRCTRRSVLDVRCRGRAVISKNGMFYHITRFHTGHGPDFLYPLEIELRRRIYARIASGDASPFVNIIREEGRLGSFPFEVRGRLCTARISTAMYNVRAQHMPRIPRNLPVLGTYLSFPQFRAITQTLDKTDSIYAGWCGDYSEGTVSVVFASKRCLQILQRATKVFADGTFKKRPKKPNTSQIFNINATWTNKATKTKHTLTLVRVFMQRRTKAAYNELFRFLKHLMPSWDPDEIMADHEEAQVLAWLENFPRSRVVTCLWHYAVDIFRYSKSLGLYPLMQAEWVFDKIVRCCCALPLLPNYMLMQGLIEIGLWARQTGFMHMPLVRDLFDYIEREWLRRYRYLSVCGSEDRTNNVSECANATLEWDLRQNRPNVYNIIRAFVIQEDQFLVVMLLVMAEQHHVLSVLPV